MFLKFWRIYLMLFLLDFVTSIKSENRDTKQNGTLYKFRHERERREAELELKEQLIKVIEHFKQENPVGLPSDMDGQIPDPMEIPDLQHSMSGARMEFKTIKLYGLKKFQLQHIRTDLSELKVACGVSLDELLVRGNYSMATWLMRSKGEFNVTVNKVWTEAEAQLSVSPEGFLQANRIIFDLKFQSLKMDFQNLGLLGNFLQGIINSVGTFIFDSIKPMILDEIEKNAIGVLNREARSVPQQFPNSINPLDMLLAASRNYIRDRGYDPFPLPDHKSEGWSTFELTEGILHGLSTIHRTGAIYIGFETNIVHVNLHLGAENLKGKYNWSWKVIGDFALKSGTMEFNLEYISAQVIVKQPANLDLFPEIEKIDLDIGNIAVLSDGAGTADYIVEAFFNIVPNIFRKQIINSLEKTVCVLIEEEIRKINLEDMVEEHL